MELKQRNIGTSKHAKDSFNRTFMELKPIKNYGSINVYVF